MNNISISDSQNYAIQQAQVNHAGHSSANNTLPMAADHVREFVALAIQPGMMAAILQGQSVMSCIDMRPSLSTPPVGLEKINSEHTGELMKLMATIKGSDISKLERAAASVSTIFNTQPNLQQNQASSGNINKSLQVYSSSEAPVSHPVHSQPPVESGTDITATNAAGRQFINMMGDLKMLELNNLLTVTLTKQEAESSKSSARSSLRAVDAAERSGNKGIDAEKQRMTGAITSGSIGLIGQGVSTTRTVKALNAESKSISNNLASAARNSSELGIHKASTGSATDAMLHKGKLLDKPINEKIGTGNSGVDISADQSRQSHNQVQLKTNQTRVTSEYSNTAIHSSQKVIDGAFNVEAANETKQAELARADQTVNNEVANTHQQAARKAAESKAALNQVLESTLNSKNNTLSSIADRIR